MLCTCTVYTFICFALYSSSCTFVCDITYSYVCSVLQTLAICSGAIDNGVYGG